MQPPTIRSNDPDAPVLEGLLDDSERRERLQHGLWWTAHALWASRRIILGITAFGAVLAIIISLTLTDQYRSSARVLLPDSGGSSINALLGSLPPQASRMLGGGQSGDYTRYLAILTSNSVTDRVIDEFDLIRLYGNENSIQPRSDTRRALHKHATFEVDAQFDFLTISVLDRDRERAAAMANFFVAELNRRNSYLSAQNAANYRQYVEARYHEVLESLNEAQLGLQRVQEEIGVVELPMAAEAFLRGAAEHRASLLELEIQHGALLQQYGPENPRVAASREALNIARAAGAAAMSGREPLMPIDMADMPAAATRYAVAYRDVLIQTELLKIAQPLFEQARFEEEREKVAVQVVDSALPAEHKAKPFRSLIVIGSTLSVFLMSIMFVLMMEWVKTRGLPMWRSLESAHNQV